MKLLAIIDARRIETDTGPATTVAGLTLLERAVRLADVGGADRIAVRHTGNSPPATADEFRRSYDQLTCIGDATSPPVDEPFDAVVVIDAGAVIKRSVFNRAVDTASDREPGRWIRHSYSHLAVCSHPTLRNLREALEDPAAAIDDAFPALSGGWIVAVDSPEAAERAERRLFNDCRKPEDGIVSRHLNRHISLAISRGLASTFVGPNHVTAVTFALGFAAAASATFGTYAGFLIAGILYQLNSVIDGVDGELARVRYEFSFLGEWLDTVSDDLADLLMYAALGVGAWRTLADAPGPFGAETWLVLGLTAAAAKLASMAVYYRWLVAEGRGDLLAFQWSFEQDDGSDSAMDAVLSNLRYLFRKDFIVFAAMILAIGGYLPHLLFALAPGNAIVAVSVIVEQVRSGGDGG